MWKRKYKYTPSSDVKYKKLYGIRSKMIERCTDPQCDRYKDYGGRGIAVCNEWLNSFDCFVEWALNNGYEEGLSIDRINNGGNYEPSNCRWITRKEQSRNKRTNLMVEYRGETKPLIEWCEQLNLKYDPIHNRITKGWDVEKAFNTPLAKPEESFSALCRKYGKNPATVRDRVNKFGWTLEDALNSPVVGRGAHRTYTYGETTCPLCGEKFIRTNSRQKYCCEECHIKSKSKSYKDFHSIA